MENLHKGKQSIIFPNRPVLTHAASVVGKKEGEGPLGSCFDVVNQDTKFGEPSWEHAESRMQMTALDTVLQKAALPQDALELVLSGDLLNQCVGSNFALRGRGIPSLGLYGACSTMAEALLLAASAVNAGYVRRALALSSSHFASSERQYRFPLGYGGQRTPTSQWTVTGAGAALVQASGTGVAIPRATVGCVTDQGVKDANNMGAAMAPAAYATIRAHLDDFSLAPSDYDLIVTGDLGSLGKSLLIELFARDGVDLSPNYEDCGVLIFDADTQDVHCGGSGCGCSAVVLCSHLLERMRRGELKRLLFCGTGALLSPVSTQQGESIPAICHAVALEANGGK